MVEWAGPVEFTTGQAVILILIFAAYFLLPPALGALIAYQRYRRITPPESRTAGGAWLAALVGAAIGVAIVIVGGWLLQAIGGF